MIRLSILLIIYFVGTYAYACSTDPHATKLSSENDAPPAFITMDVPKIAQPFAARIELCGDHNFEELSFGATMPAHQHGMNYNVKVTQIAPGLFDVENIVFHMPGIWKIQVEEIGGTQNIYTKELVVE